MISLNMSSTNWGSDERDENSWQWKYDIDQLVQNYQQIVYSPILSIYKNLDIVL